MIKHLHTEWDLLGTLLVWGAASKPFILSFFWKDSLIQCDIAKIHFEWKLKTTEAKGLTLGLDRSNHNSTLGKQKPQISLIHDATLDMDLLPTALLPWRETAATNMLKYQKGQHVWYLQPLRKTMRVENRQTDFISPTEKLVTILRYHSKSKLAFPSFYNGQSNHTPTYHRQKQGKKIMGFRRETNGYQQ